MKHLTYELAKELVQEAIAERGEDFVYTPPEGVDDCMYVHDDEPGCIVGHVLISGLGLASTLLESIEGQDASHALSLAVRHGIIIYDDDAEIYLLNLQAFQDSGDSWGKADRLARAGMGDHGDSTT